MIGYVAGAVAGGGLWAFMVATRDRGGFAEALAFGVMLGCLFGLIGWAVS